MTTNRKSKTLIDNWVEERQCAHLEAGNRNPDGSICTKLHREGHQGILSTCQATAGMAENATTATDCFLPPAPPRVRVIGKREETLRQQLYQVVSAQVQEEFHPPPPPPDYTSTTKKDFGKDFTPTKAPSTMEHDAYSEHPVTYWIENRDKVTGVTQEGCSGSPFSKNAAFSTPIGEYLDQPKPHGTS